MMLHDGDGSSGSPSCICSQQRSSQSHCSTLDEVSEEVEDEEDDSSCSPSCDCQHSSSSTCHSPVTESEPTIGRKKREPSNGESGRNRQPFFLHPRKEVDLASLSRTGPTKTSFFLNPADQLENRKNQNLSSQHHRHHHHRRHHENQHAEQQHSPFYLHDPNSIVYTRVKELFGCEYQQDKRTAGNKKSTDKSRSVKSCDSRGSATSHSCSSMATSQAESSVSDSSSARSQSSASLSHDDDHNNNLISSTQTSESQVCRKRVVKIDTFELINIFIASFYYRDRAVERLPVLHQHRHRRQHRRLRLLLLRPLHRPDRIVDRKTITRKYIPCRIQTLEVFIKIQMPLRGTCPKMTNPTSFPSHLHLVGWFPNISFFFWM